MIKIYGHPRSRSTRAVWAAEEAGIDYEFIKVDLAGGEHRRPPYTDLNPSAGVPTLVDGDLVLTESAAICTYIGQQNKPKALVADESPAARALYDKWCFFVVAELEQPLWTMAKHTFVLPEELRVPQVKQTAKVEFARVLESLSKQLGDEKFITAGRFTMADILLAHTLSWAGNAKQDLTHVNIKDYTKRSTQRAGLERARSRESGAE